MDMDIIEIQPPKPELLCCRACLLTDCRLFNMHEYKLEDAFNRITGIPVLNSDILPRYLCTFCRTLLLKCAVFRTTCLQAQQCLKSNLPEVELSTDVIRKIDRVSLQVVNFNITPMEIIEIEGEQNDIVADPAENVNSYKINIDFTENIKKEVESDTNHNFKHENDRDIDDVNQDLDGKVTINEPTKVVDITCKEPDLKIEFEVKNGGFNFNVVPESKSKKARKRNIKDTDSTRCVPKSADAPIRNKTIKKKTPDLLKDETDTAIGSELITDVNSEEKNTTSDEATDARDSTEVSIPYESPMLKKTRIEKSGSEISKKVRRRKQAKSRTPDREFETTYGVDIIILSQQDQMEEIAARKQSANYKKSLYKCEECGKGFQSKQTYENHSVRHDPSCGEFPCPVCGMRFPDARHCRKHGAVHGTKLICRECGFVSRSRASAKRHHNEHLGKRYTCEYCGESYGKSTTYFGHVRFAHAHELVSCDECGDTFIGKGLVLHKKKMHKQNVKRFQCTVCSASFVSSDALDRHADTDEHTGLSPCEQCGMNCASEEELHAHKAVEHAPESYVCEECSASFTNPAARELHARRRHRAGAGGAPRRRVFGAGPAMCDQCGRTYDCAARLHYHYSMKHSAKAEFECPVCPKSFPTRSLRKIHMRCHTNERPYRCPGCPRAFHSQNNCNRHYKSMHLGLHDNAECQVCGRVCTTKAGLRLHIDSVHNGKPWPKRDRLRQTRNKKESLT